MKKILLLIAVSTSVLAGCEKSFLTEVPESQATDVAFYKTTADMTNAVTAAYEPLRSMYYGGFGDMMEGRGDNVENLNPGANAGTEFNIDRFIARSDNTLIRDVWGNVYNAISRSNVALEHLDVVDDAGLKAQYEGELKFLRALHYFNIVRL